MRKRVELLTAVVTWTLCAACSLPVTTATDDSAAPGPTDSTPTTKPVTTAPTTALEHRYAATVDELMDSRRPVVLAHTGGEDEYPASTTPSVPDAVKAWAGRNDCAEGDPTPHPINEGVTLLSGQCPARSTTLLYRIRTGSTWPETDDLIWRFFLEHPLAR